MIVERQLMDRVTLAIALRDTITSYISAVQNQLLDFMYRMDEMVSR
jgi:hypothetical protein